MNKYIQSYLNSKWAEIADVGHRIGKVYSNTKQFFNDITFKKVCEGAGKLNKKTNEVGEAVFGTAFDVSMAILPMAFWVFGGLMCFLLHPLLGLAYVGLTALGSATS